MTSLETLSIVRRSNLQEEFGRGRERRSMAIYIHCENIVLLTLASMYMGLRLYCRLVIGWWKGEIAYLILS